jgi:hypothetical protein
VIAAKNPPAPAPPPSVATTKHKLIVNTQPWSNFTVDGAGSYQTQETIELAPGPHRFHFDNPTLHITRDATFDMPDRDERYVIDLQK